MQEHCHPKAILGSGRCGLVGNFGFEKGHYEVSMACAERTLVPAVRSADPETAVGADGFSCRTHVEQALGRRPLHLAEVLPQACPSAEPMSASAQGDA